MPKRKHAQVKSESFTSHSLPHPRQSQIVTMTSTTPIPSVPIIHDKKNKTKLIDILYYAHEHDKLGNYTKARNGWIRVADRVRKRRTLCNGNCLEVKYADDETQLPLHLAIDQGAPYVVIRALVEIYPTGCELAFGLSPLHLTCAYPRKKHMIRWGQKVYNLEDDPDSEQIIRLLMKTYPKAIRREGENKEMTTPFHLILENKPSEGLVKTMVKHYDKITRDDDGVKSIFQIKDGQGQLPLHIAVENQSSINVVRFIHKGYPAATKCQREHDGCFALHCAVLFGNSEACFTEIMESFPRALELYNHRTETPLHMLFVSGNEGRWSSKK